MLDGDGYFRSTVSLWSNSIISRILSSFVSDLEILTKSFEILTRLDGTENGYQSSLEITYDVLHKKLQGQAW